MKWIIFFTALKICTSFGKCADEAVKMKRNRDLRTKHNANLGLLINNRRKLYLETKTISSFDQYSKDLKMHRSEKKSGLVNPAVKQQRQSTFKNDRYHCVALKEGTGIFHSHTQFKQLMQIQKSNQVLENSLQKAIRSNSFTKENLLNTKQTNNHNKKKIYINYSVNINANKNETKLLFERKKRSAAIFQVSKTA